MIKFLKGITTPLTIPLMAVSLVLSPVYCAYKYGKEHKETKSQEKQKPFKDSDDPYVNAQLKALKALLLWDRCVELVCPKTCAERGYLDGTSATDNELSQLVLCRCDVKNSYKVVYFHVKVFIDVDKSTCKYKEIK